MTDVKELLDQGLAAHRSGNVAEAIVAYRRALALKPDDAELLSLMGLALSQGGRPDEALLLLGQAVDREPNTVGLRVNLAEGLIAAGQRRRALQEYQSVVALQPDHVRAWDRIGDLQSELGDSDAAVDGWGRSYLVDYVNVEAALKVARLEIGREHTDVALTLLDSVLARAPGEAGALALKCSVLERRSDWPALLRTAVDWSRVRPADADAWRMLSRAAFESGRQADAIGAYRRVLQLARPPTATDWSAYAGLCLHALDFGAAADALDRAEQLDAEAVQTLANRALLLVYQGQFAKAEEYCRRCLAIDPTHVLTYTTLSRLRSGRLTDAELQSVAALSRREDLAADRRIPAALVVARAHDARKEFDVAFAAYSQAHELAGQRDRSEGHAYDRQAQERRTQRIIELSRLTLPVPAAATRAMRPIFIVGMPRSGATLIESVLATHSRVLAMGELPTMPQVLRAFLEADSHGVRPDAKLMTSWARSYLADFAVADDKDHVTDKQPLNFEAVGLIAQLFPEAPIVHVRRDPVETGLAIFCQEFNRQWRFAHRLDDIGHFHANYARLAQHWQEALPQRVITIQYEEFIVDFERQAQQLVERCGLDWPSGGLDLQDDLTRALAAFGAEQARKSTQTSETRVARYGTYLQPLIEELERGGVDLRTGAIR